MSQELYQTACSDLIWLIRPHSFSQGYGDPERDFQLLLQRAADEAAATGSAASSTAAKLQRTEVVSVFPAMQTAMPDFNNDIPTWCIRL
jgi:hypothetical protein